MRRRRNEADVGERGVAPADVRRIEERLAQVVVMGDRLDALARVGDGDHQLAGMLVARGVPASEGLLGAVPGIGLEGERLRGRAGLAGNDEERGERVEVVDDCRDRGRIGRVEDPQVQPALAAAECLDEDLRGEAAAAHTRHDRRREPRVADPFAEPLEGGDLVGEVSRGIEPAEAIGDRGLDAGVGRPEGRVAGEESLRPALVAGAIDGLPIDGLVLAQGEPGW